MRLELVDYADFNFKQFPLKTTLKLWERKKWSRRQNGEERKGKTDLLYSSWKGRISRSWRSILKKGQSAARQENSINIMQERASKEMSRTFQENRKRKVWNTGTRNCTSAVEGSLHSRNKKQSTIRNQRAPGYKEKMKKHNVLQQQTSPHKTPRILIRENRADPQSYFLPHIQPTNCWEFKKPELTVTF